ncbi:hypothetical protein BDY19DRAFT_993956 [Irpex rosettiformis]|uniref:Uncharacterized protein n=1 Tax=Irpex rosettiformis TaxID=378272 RepID=A0ACB8U302_9APHY|nr:hypothetical protein BDY19DRAFT_993956 [Irpex rosettiformis]
MSSAFSLTFSSHASVASSFSEATPTNLLQIPDGRQDGREEQKGTLLVGCEDGSLFLLHSKTSPGPSPPSPPAVSEVSPVSPLLSGRRKPYRAASRSRSPASPSSQHTPFHVTKPRVVSSVSAEQAEAPKNFVDFEDEQEKMKNMLKRKGVKEKTVMDSLMPGVEKAFGPDKCAEAGTTKEGDATHTASTPLSPASSTYSLSRPSSVSNIPSLILPDSQKTRWNLLCHTIPHERARLSSVTSLKAISRHPLALSLHRSGEVGVYSLLDGSCQVSASAEGGVFPIPSGGKPQSRLPLIWHWQALHVVAQAETFLIVVCATSEATTSTMHPSDVDSNHTEDTRIAAFELLIERAADPDGVLLTKIGDWTFEGPLQGIALHSSSDGQNYLLHVDMRKHLIKQRVVLSRGTSGTDSPLPIAGSTSNLPLPNPFKALTGQKSIEHLEDIDDDPFVDLNLTDTLDLGPLPLEGSITGLRFDSADYLASGLAWSQKELLLFDISGLSVQALGSVQLAGIHNVLRHDHNYVTVGLKDSIELHKLDVAPTHTGDASASIILSSLVQSHPVPEDSLAVITAPGHSIVTRKKNGRRRLERISLAPQTPDIPPRYVFWKASRIEIEAMKNESVPQVSAMLPVELNYLLLGYADGFLERTSMTSLVQRKFRGPLGRMSNIPLPGVITTINIAQLDRIHERRIIAGVDDGSIAIFSYESMKLLARWTVFIEPLKQVIQVQSGRLQGCILCISRDGSIALIALDGCEFLYLVPASVAPLQKVCLGEDNLLLAYADKRARLWDIKTREFWRSMSLDKVEEMLRQGGWTEWPLPIDSNVRKGVFSFVDVSYSPDAGSSLVIDIDDMLLTLSGGVLHTGGQKESKNDLEAKRIYIRSLVSPLLTAGLNADIDRMCLEKVGSHKALFGLYRSDSMSIYATEGSRQHWTISPDVSALRAVSIIAFLHALLLYDDKPDAVHTISTFYSASVGQIVGEGYQPTSLTLLARIWLKSRSSDLRFASRHLFEAGVARLIDEQVNDLVEGWHVQLPCSQNEAKRDSTTSALALFICGSVAVDKYALLPSTVLTDIAKSISLYLHDEHSPHRALAIDLCSRGFPVWQQHVDAVEMLRSLFALATSSRKDTNFNVGQQARNAVLQIASGNSPLFMTTVSMDILQPKNVQHRKSVMQLVIFLIHKKPLVLYSNLPRLVEAVVKSLDPNSNANRDAVLDSATEILGHLVETYPSIDFHGPTQRLAIGTSEGAVVMYDLKTATRLYVLEGHTKRTTACAFSPDGRRLVTLSLEEHTVLVWKVGSSFTSFFMPGAPPRQGHAGSEPYKTYDFHIGDEGEMTLAATLELVKFEWLSDRSVKIRIRGATLTFSV